MMPFERFRQQRRREQAAQTLYEGVVAQARQPALYLDFGVPDSVDGRFDLVVLHAFLLMRRLKRIAQGDVAQEAAALSQALFDLMFADMDQNLREMGVSDLSVGRKVKQMAKAFYGRVAAYEAALAAGGEPLVQALARNLYGTVTPSAGQLAAMASYVVHQTSVLEGQGESDILAGRVHFAPPEQ
jgi:cytochrome b pre-mRNA-processing protein 3